MRLKILTVETATYASAEFFLLNKLKIKKNNIPKTIALTAAKAKLPIKYCFTPIKISSAFSIFSIFNVASKLLLK